jgi:hypothetical protein
MSINPTDETMKYAAIFRKAQNSNGGYYIFFPDLMVSVYCDSFNSAFDIAPRVLSAQLASFISKGKALPDPTPEEKIQLNSSFSEMIIWFPGNPDACRIRKSALSVKRTVTLPEWLEYRANQEHINLSSFLVAHLQAHLEQISYSKQ